MKIWGRKQVDIFTIVRVNDRIKLVIENESYMSRVENISEKELIVASPLDRAGVINVRPNTKMMVDVFQQSDLRRYSCTVESNLVDRVPLLVLTGFHDMGMVQNRRYVRVDACLPIRYREDSDSTDAYNWRNAMSFNISGSGLLISKEYGSNLHQGDFVDLEIKLPEGPPVFALARVVRETVSYGDLPRVGLEFEQIHPEDRRRIIRFVNKRELALSSESVEETKDEDIHIKNF
ncbi:MAG TPA: PilZ domain-containing protein [Armatimonadota bacterium]|nr:PilZ domain-containing protein [Armatimonadota bacterium]